MRACRYRAGQTPAEATAWQQDLRARLWRALQLEDLVLAPPVPLAESRVASESHTGFTRRQITLASTAGRRIEALVTQPTGINATQAYPAVVCLHGHGGDRFAVHEAGSIYKGFAAALTGHGMATIAVDVGQHEVYEPGRLLMGERLWDCRRAVDWLVAQPWVDAGRIGCAGLSLGGEMAMWLGAMDPHIAAVVSAGFLTTMDQMEQNHCLCWRFDGLRELVDYADIYALTAPRPLQCQNGLGEGPTQFHVPLARQALAEIEPAYADLGAPQAVSLHVHDGGHEIDLPALLAFFGDELAAGENA